MEHDLRDINQRSCQNIFEIMSINRIGEISNLAPRLIVPKYHGNSDDDRLSEQEARFLFANVLNHSTLFYSIETPTKKLYSFSGKTERSAMTDLTIYKRIGERFIPQVNVEFKAHNCTQSGINKDIEKLLREDIPFGNWFHIFENADSATIKELMQKFAVAIDKVIPTGIISKKILFTVVVKDKGWACTKMFDCGDHMGLTICADKFFTIVYHVEKGIIVVDNANGWEVIENR